MNQKKQKYVAPVVEEVLLDVESVMMTASKEGDTSLDDTPATPDAPSRRGDWGNFWN